MNANINACSSQFQGQAHKKLREKKREAELLFDDPRLPRTRNKMAQLVRNNVTVFFTVDDACSVEEEEKKKDYFWSRKNMAKFAKENVNLFKKSSLVFFREWNEKELSEVSFRMLVQGTHDVHVSEAMSSLSLLHGISGVNYSNLDAGWGEGGERPLLLEEMAFNQFCEWQSKAANVIPQVRQRHIVILTG